MLPPTGETWVALSDEALPVADALAWATRPECGAVVMFSGTARDHAPGRDGVWRLEYEAYESQVVPRLEAVVAELRSRWPDVRAVAVLHRVGVLDVGDTAVVVVTSSPHRDASFHSARFAIDTLKATVPIWKRESWSDGESWGLEAQHLREAGEVEAVAASAREATS